MAVKSLVRSGVDNFEKYSSLLAGNIGYDTYFEHITTTTLGSAVASVTFSDLDELVGTYQHLQVRWTARSDRSGTYSDILGMEINGSTSSYKTHQLVGNGSSVSSGVPTPTNYLSFEYIHASLMTSNVYSAGVIDILDPFSSSKNKTIRALWAGESGNAIRTSIYMQSGLSFISTASISTIKFETKAGGSLIAGSRFSLYGLR